MQLEAKKIPQQLLQKVNVQNIEQLRDSMQDLVEVLAKGV